MPLKYMTPKHLIQVKYSSCVIQVICFSHTIFISLLFSLHQAWTCPRYLEDTWTASSSVASPTYVPITSILCWALPAMPPSMITTKSWPIYLSYIILLWPRGISPMVSKGHISYMVSSTFYISWLKKATLIGYPSTILTSEKDSEQFIRSFSWDVRLYGLIGSLKIPIFIFMIYSQNMDVLI